MELVRGEQERDEEVNEGGSQRRKEGRDGASERVSGERK